MKKFIILAALALSGCANGGLSVRTCQQAAAGLATAAQLAQVFIDQGIETAKAQKLAIAVTTGQMLLAVACAQANPVSP